MPNATGARRDGRLAFVRSADTVGARSSGTGAGSSCRGSGMAGQERGQDVLFWVVMGVAIALVGVFSVLVMRVPPV